MPIVTSLLFLMAIAHRLIAKTDPSCCLPQQVSGKEYVYANEMFTFHYDFGQKKFYQDYRGRDEIQYVLFDTKKMIKYTRYTNHACRINPISESVREHFSRCIPDDAISVPGSIENNIDFFYQKKERKGLVIARVQRGTCRPNTVVRHPVVDVYDGDKDFDDSIFTDLDYSDCL